MTDWLAGAVGRLSSFDAFVIVANALLAVFSPQIIRKVASRSASDRQHRIAVLRLLSVGLLVMYCVSLLLPESSLSGSCKDAAGCDPLGNISLTGLTLLFSYAAYILLHAWILRRFGRERQIVDQKVFARTYQSELFSLLVLIMIIVIAFLSILSVWDVEEWLKSTSVLGGILLVLFFTKDIWLPDNINGLILLYNNDLEPGSIVRIESMDLLAVVLRTNLIQTTFRDIVHRHQIIVPNSQLRGCKIDLLSQTPSGGLPQYVDFMIGYDVKGPEVDAFLHRVWRRACNAESAINADAPPRVFLADNADHAIRWRLFYSVSNVYRINLARYAINRAAHDQSVEEGIGLNTPFTHAARIHGD